MTGRALKVTRIGNSRGVRLPADTLARYAIADEVLMEETEAGILLKPVRGRHAKLSWEETARAMAAEDWSAWDVVAADGLESIPWDRAKSRRVAESKRSYVVSKRKK